MGPLGVPELIFILVIALLIFGPKRLPEFGRTIGKALGEFRRASTDLKRSIDVELTASDEPRGAAAGSRPPTPAVARDPAEESAGRAQPAFDEIASDVDGDAEEADAEEADAEEPEDGSVN